MLENRIKADQITKIVSTKADQITKIASTKADQITKTDNFLRL
jgi:hypothetical protein